MDNSTRKNRATDYLKYFGEMDLTENERNERIALAEELDDVFFFLFALVLLQIDTNKDFDINNLSSSTIQRYKDALKRFGYDLEKANRYLNEYVATSVTDIIDSTITHISDPYYLSQDRAEYIAENEANAVKNYVAFKQAIKDGKTKKKWVTKHDRFVRHSHILVDGEEIGIYDAFEVGDCLMLYPKDILNGNAQECVNCRCVLKFSGSGGKKVEETKKERVSTIDEMHIGTTDDMLHIGTTDDEYLHIGAVTDSLHIGTTDNPISDIKKAIEKSEAFTLVEKLSKGNLKILRDYKPNEISSMFNELGYPVTITETGYIIEIDKDKTLEYRDEKQPYYIFKDKNKEIKVDMDGNEIKDS